MMRTPYRLKKIANMFRRVLYPLGNGPRSYPAEFNGSLEDTRNLLIFLTDNVHRKCWDERGGYFKTGRSFQRSSAGAHADRLEMAARSFLGAAYFHQHAEHLEWRERYLEAIRRGTQPGSDYFWGNIQSTAMLVENTSLITGLMLKPDVFWERLTAGEKKNFTGYITDCSRKQFYESNWLWFKVFHLLFLEKMAGVPQEKNIHALLDQIGSFYDGEGWYNDGRAEQERRYDHYNAWAMHYYGLLFCRLAGGNYDRHKEELKRRAREFYDSYRHFFSSDGLPVAWGRSLIYRFGMLSFFALFISEGLASPDELSHIKQNVISTMRGFLAENILDADGLLSLGYFGASAALLEPYSGDGSPYWAFKFFAFFLLPPDHPYWASQPQAFAAQDTKPIRSLGVTVKANGRHRFFLNGGLNSRLYTWKYGKFAYSNIFMQTLDEKYADNSFVFKSGASYKTRDIIHSFREAPDGGWHTHWGSRGVDGLQVYSTLIPLRDGYVLASEVDAEHRMDYFFCGFKMPKPGVAVARSKGSFRLVSEYGVSALGVFHDTAGSLDSQSIPRSRALDSRESILPVYRASLNPGHSRIVFSVQAATTENTGAVHVELQENGIRLTEGDSVRILKRNGFYYE